MKKCPFCGADIEENAQFCLYCLNSLIEKEQILIHKKKKPQGLVLLGAFAAAAMILLLLLLARKAMPDPVNPSERETISTTLPSTSTQVTTEPTTQATKPTEEPTTEPTEEVTEPTEEETEPTQAATQPTEKPTRPTEQGNSSTKPSTQPTTQPTEPEAEPTEPHIHSFHLKYTTEEFLQSEATCECPAIYYYSCPCGQKGEEIFLSGNAKGHTLVTLEGYPPPDCVTSGKTDGSYCNVCQQVVQKQNQIPASGHLYAFSSSPSPCMTCGEMGTLTVVAPDFPYNYQDKYRVNSGYFTVLPYNSARYTITMVFNYTNISSQPTEGYPFAGPGITHSGTYLEPGESGIYESCFQVSSPYGTYQAYFA